MASSVDLGNQLEGFVSQLVKTGRYNSRSEILREGVRLIHERETRLAALDASIRRGIADADHGRVHDLDTVLATLDAKYAGSSRGSGKP
jgi:antitoxin ParD1/3/4